MIKEDCSIEATLDATPAKPSSHMMFGRNMADTEGTANAKMQARSYVT